MQLFPQPWLLEFILTAVLKLRQVMCSAPNDNNTQLSVCWENIYQAHPARQMVVQRKQFPLLPWPAAMGRSHKGSALSLELKTSMLQAAHSIFSNNRGLAKQLVNKKPIMKWSQLLEQHYLAGSLPPCERAERCLPFHPAIL